MSDLLYWIWLSGLISPGSSKFLQIISKVHHPETAYGASASRLEGLGLSPELAALLSDKNTEEASVILNYCKRNGVKIIPYDHPTYPDRLRRIDNPPVLIYVMGDLPDVDDNVCIATVGTRQYTEYGEREAYTISYDLASGGAVIVSGLARGIDSICHRGCIDAFGTTVAVIGNGIDVVYPSENAGLYAEVIRNGAIVTEYKPGTRPLGRNFPVRNRIISGLSLGTLVLEAKERSGSLITAEYALRQGRDLFALPGKVGDLNSLGTNALIKSGAKMVTEASDVLEEYEYLFPNRIKIENIGKNRSKMRIPRVFTPRFKAAEPEVPIVNDVEIVKDERAGKVHAEKKQPKNSAVTEKEPKAAPDLSMLDDTSRKVFLSIPEGKDVSPDELVGEGLGISDILVALTMLEINKLVSNAPGGKYRRTQ